MEGSIILGDLIRGLPGVIYPGVKILQKLSLGKFHRGKIPGGFMQKKLSGGKITVSNCSGGGFMGGNCVGVSCSGELSQR